MKLRALDHLAILASSLGEAFAYVSETLGVNMPLGGAHREMGSHNLLLRIGESIFLEAIAIDPSQPSPKRPRWFGLDDVGTIQSEWRAGRRLRAWVARDDNLDATLRRYGKILGEATSVSRGDRSWRISVKPDGALAESGAAPSLIDWGPRGSPAASMPDLGVTLLDLTIEHPEPQRIRNLLKHLEIENAPAIEYGRTMRAIARFMTPDGERYLT